MREARLRFPLSDWSALKRCLINGLKSGSHGPQESGSIISRRRAVGSRMRRGGPYAHRSMFATVESHSDGPRVAKNFKNRMGSSAAKNSPTDAVTTADISLTVRAHDHAGLGSPPPKHLGVQSGVGMPSPALLLPCNSLLALTTISRAGQITARKPNQPDPDAGSRRARASDIC